MKTVGYWDIIKAWERSGYSKAPSSDIRDVLYSVPDWEWLCTKFATEFRARWSEYGLSNYTPESGDCDDYTLAAKHLLAQFWRKQEKTGPARGMLFSDVMFVREFDSIPHIVNWTLCWEGDWFVGIFEPQRPGAIIHSLREKASIWF